MGTQETTGIGTQDKKGLKKLTISTPTSVTQSSASESLSNRLRFFYSTIKSIYTEDPKTAAGKHASRGIKVAGFGSIFALAVYFGLRELDNLSGSDHLKNIENAAHLTPEQWVESFMAISLVILLVSMHFAYKDRCVQQAHQALDAQYQELSTTFLGINAEKVNEILQRKFPGDIEEQSQFFMDFLNFNKQSELLYGSGNNMNAQISVYLLTKQQEPLTQAIIEKIQKSSEDHCIELVNYCNTGYEKHSPFNIDKNSTPPLTPTPNGSV